MTFWLRGLISGFRHLMYFYNSFVASTSAAAIVWLYSFKELKISSSIVVTRAWHLNLRLWEECFCLCFSFSDFLCGSTVILFYITLRLFRYFWECITGSFKLSFSFSGLFYKWILLCWCKWNTEVEFNVGFCYKNKGYEGINECKNNIHKNTG